jgi:hypothetical protein
MSRKKTFIRWVSTAALTAAVWTSSIGGLPSASAASSLFSDVGQGHWAVKHVTKLALQGIVSGKGNGIFDPSGSIRREDAVIIAINFMGLADQIDRSAPVTLPSTLKVDDYAVHYVNEAIKRNLLYIEEEVALVNAEKLEHWGKSNASREWVTRLLVRAIGKEAEAVENGGQITSFADDGSIGPEYKAYVVTAVENGLISGMTPTQFEPKLPINRASIATLISKAQYKLNVAYSGQVYGIMLKLEPEKITLLHQDGEIREYRTNADTMYAKFDSDQPASRDSMKLYSQVMLIHNANSTIGYVEQVDNETHIRTEEGSFSKVDKDSSQIWLAVGSGFKAYRYDALSEPYVADSTGKTVSLADIPEGAAVTLTLDSQDRVLSVAVKQALVNKTGSGTVVSWDPASGALEVSDPATGQVEKWSVSPNAVFKLENTPITKEELKIDASITYEVKNGTIVSIVMAKPLFTTVEGKLYSVDKSNRTIVYLVDGKPEAKFLADIADVVIEGMPNPGLDDLQKDDTVTLTLNADDKVTKVTVAGRSVQYLTATVGGYVSRTKTLSLIPENGTKPINLVLNDNVRYDLNGTTISEADALRRITDGKKITVAYSGDNLIAVYFIGKYTGTVVENNLTTKKLTLRIDAANTVTLPYSFPYVDMHGKDNLSYVDVKAGDQVTVVLNDNQDHITSIQYRTTTQFEVVSVNLFGMSLVLKAPGSQTYMVSESVQLTDEQGNKISLSQVTQGSLVNVTLNGKFNIEKIKLAPRVYGRVAAVNTSDSKLDIVLTDGKMVTRSVGSSPIVIKGASNIAFSALQPNDRVEIRTDENDRVVIRVIAGTSKEVRDYNSSSGKLRVKVSNLNETSEYTLDSSAYIHQNGNSLTASELKNGDKIMIYVLDSKVVEIEKL